MYENSANMSSQTIGLDLSDETFTCVVLSPDGNTLAEAKFPTSKEGLESAFGKAPTSRIVLEASTQTPWVARKLQAMGHEVIVANPRRLHLISKSSRKTDRNDADTLARIGRVDPQLLHPIWLRDEKTLAVRAALRARRQLVWSRTRLINLVRAECKVHGTTLPTCTSSAFARRARPAMPEILQPFLTPVLDTIEALTRQVCLYDEQLERVSREEFPETQLLRQVPGVGPLVALTYAVTLGDPKRFRESRQVGAYLGLVPRVYQSGLNDPNLRISKEGDRDLRTLLVTAATYILRRSSPDSAIKRFGRRIATRGHPRDKARARIAVARKLAVLLHRLWMTGEVYQPLPPKA
jgi:transposase